MSNARIRRKKIKKAPITVTFGISGKKFEVTDLKLNIRSMTKEVFDAHNRGIAYYFAKAAEEFVGTCRDQEGNTVSHGEDCIHTTADYGCNRCGYKCCRCGE